MRGNHRPRLLVPVLSRLWQDDAGRWRTGSSHASATYWAPYTSMFSAIVIIGRRRKGRFGEGLPVSGPGIEVWPLSSGEGRVAYVASLLSALRVWPRLRASDVAFIRAPSILGPVAVLPHVLRRRRLLVHVVGDAETALANLVPQRWVGWHASFTRWLVRQADAALYVTERALQERFPAAPWALTSVKRNILPRDFKIAGQPTAEEGAHPLTVVTAGTQEQMYKGHDVLLEAVRKVLDDGVAVSAVIIGGGRHHDALVRRATDLGLTDAVRFTGQLSSSREVGAEVAAADLFVLPSRTEGTPRVLLEAMCLGKPCLASDVGGVGELLPPTCLVPPGDVDALASAIRRLATDRKGLLECARISWNSARRILEQSADDTLLEALVRVSGADSTPPV